eukprot:364370-Chlamydomonas_euryale.AAC.2
MLAYLRPHPSATKNLARIPHPTSPRSRPSASMDSTRCCVRCTTHATRAASALPPPSCATFATTRRTRQRSTKRSFG